VRVLAVNVHLSATVVRVSKNGNSLVAAVGFLPPENTRCTPQPEMQLHKLNYLRKLSGLHSGCIALEQHSQRRRHSCVLVKSRKVRFLS